MGRCGANQSCGAPHPAYDHRGRRHELCLRHGQDHLAAVLIPLALKGAIDGGLDADHSRPVLQLARRDSWSVLCWSTAAWLARVRTPQALKERARLRNHDIVDLHWMPGDGRSRTVYLMEPALREGDGVSVRAQSPMGELDQEGGLARTGVALTGSFRTLRLGESFIAIRRSHVLSPALALLCPRRGLP